MMFITYPNLMPKLQHVRNIQSNYQKTKNDVPFGINFLQDLSEVDQSLKILQGLADEIFKKTGLSFNLSEMRLLSFDKQILEALKIPGRVTVVEPDASNSYVRVITDKMTKRKASFLYHTGKDVPRVMEIAKHTVALRMIYCDDKGRVSYWMDFEKKGNFFFNEGGKCILPPNSK